MIEILLRVYIIGYLLVLLLTIFAARKYTKQYERFKTGDVIVSAILWPITVPVALYKCIKDGCWK